jgi:uroporphyrinogen decarboxylase
MNKLVNCLTDTNNSCIPIWFMRQAGRYLPEFKKIRSQNQDFIKLCLDSHLSSEITLQPIKRYNLDAAIIFSDILMVPYALRQDVKFKKGSGPVLSDFDINVFLNNNVKEFSNKLKPVYDAIKLTRSKLDKNKSLIGFVGSPWTLIVYMLGLKKEKNILDLDLVKKKEPQINLILEKINDYLSIHIKNQINAGANIVQIFDSWAGLIPNENLNDYCFSPNLNLVNFCKKHKIPTICFPKGLNKNYSKFLEIVKPDVISIDYDLDPEWVRNNFENVCIQGGMDPKALFMEDKKMFQIAKKYLDTFKDRPYIFNLGHGLLPETNPDKVKKLINFVRNYKNEK